MGDEIEFFAGLLAWILGGLLQIALERVSSIVHGLPGQGAGALALGIAGLGLAWLFFKLVKMLIIFACVAAIGALAIRFVLA